MSKRKTPIPVRIVETRPSRAIADEYKPKDSLSISVRQIDNGYLINRHGYKDGKHFDREHFSPTEPKLPVPERTPRGPTHPGSPGGRAGRLRNAKI